MNEENLLTLAPTYPTSVMRRVGEIKFTIDRTGRSYNVEAPI